LLTIILDEKKADGKEEEKIVGQCSFAHAISPMLNKHIALDDSDIQILKTYVRHPHNWLVASMLTLP
jgi:hypothetical protein